jgi:hypothetical protein
MRFRVLEQLEQRFDRFGHCRHDRQHRYGPEPPHDDRLDSRQ